MHGDHATTRCGGCVFTFGIGWRVGFGEGGGVGGFGVGFLFGVEGGVGEVGGIGSVREEVNWKYLIM